MFSRDGKTSGGDGGTGSVWSKAVAEVSKQILVALPMTGTNLVQFAVQLVSVMFVGHLGELELSSASIATSFSGVTGYSFLLGLSTALETLCGQAYGAERYSSLGIYLQQAVLVLSFISLPIAVIWFNMENVLLFFGQDPIISRKAGEFTQYLIPGLFSYPFLHPLVKFLQTQSIVMPMFLCSSFTLLVHYLLCWVLICIFKMDNRAAAISVSVSNWLNVTLLVAVIVVTPKCKQCWHGFSKKAFGNIKEFLKLAIPSAVTVCLEWWSFEALVLLSGLLPNPQLETSVFSILLNMVRLCYMIPYGLGAAASIRVSNELGAGRPAAARFAFLVSMALAVIDGTVVASTLLLARHILGRAFSNEAEVVLYVSHMAPLLAWVSAMDAIQGTISGEFIIILWSGLQEFPGDVVGRLLQPLQTWELTI